MAADAWVYYDSFKEELLDKTHDLTTDVIKIALFLSTYTPSVSSDATYAGIAGVNEHANANGYTTAGATVASTTNVVASGVDSIRG